MNNNPNYYKYWGKARKREIGEGWDYQLVQNIAGLIYFNFGIIQGTNHSNERNSHE
jgi:hypothetical protein